jgi:hypothetical protein
MRLPTGRAGLEGTRDASGVLLDAGPRPQKNRRLVPGAVNFRTHTHEVLVPRCTRRMGGAMESDRQAKRWILLGLSALGFGAAACSKEGAKTGCMICGSLAVLGGEIAAEGHAAKKAKESCGACPAGQTCNFLEAPPRCEADGAEGNRCGKWDQDPKVVVTCGAGLSCNAGYTPSVCRTPEAAGGKCGLATDCNGGGKTFASGLRCVAGVCGRGLEEGAPCTATTWDAQGNGTCAAGLLCNPGASWARGDRSMRGVCLPPQPLNGPCLHPGDCGPGVSCDNGDRATYKCTKTSPTD